MPDEEGRVTVSTYVPAHQRERWRADAERLGMSQSEFVRSMVQAGRRGFAMDGETEDRVEPDLPGSNPRGNDLKTAVHEILREEGPLGWPELTEAVIGDLEEDLESALIELQAENRIRHSPREGTYSLAEGADGE
jgi:hypothetical protein